MVRLGLVWRYLWYRWHAVERSKFGLSELKRRSAASDLEVEAFQKASTLSWGFQENLNLVLNEAKVFWKKIQWGFFYNLAWRDEGFQNTSSKFCEKLIILLFLLTMILIHFSPVCWCSVVTRFSLKVPPTSFPPLLFLWSVQVGQLQFSSPLPHHPHALQQ